MYLSSVSNISLVKDMTSNLLGQQRTLHLLSNQLSTGVKSNNLTDYSPTEAKRLLSLSAALSQRDAYLFSINSARDNMSFYEVTLTQISKILDLAISFSSNNNVYSAYTANTIATQATGYLDSLTALFNQTIGGKFVYSGARYNTAPVANLATLPPITLPPDPLVTDPDLPPYDSEYTSLGVNPFAYVTRKATIDENYVLDYGITSNDPVFQKIIQGLRFMQAAGNATNETDYRANLDVAVSLLRSSALELQKLHTTVIGNDYLANSQKTSQINIMTNLTNQLASIQQVDKTEVAVRIQDMTANIQASYSVTGSLLKLSILNYL